MQADSQLQRQPQKYRRFHNSQPEDRRVPRTVQPDRHRQEPGQQHAVQGRRGTGQNKCAHRKRQFGNEQQQRTGAQSAAKQRLIGRFTDVRVVVLKANSR
jgi:hypothetical protein